MTPGSIYFDTDFKFIDGATGRKLFVVLNDGNCGFYLGVKTTTNPKYKGTNEGCQSGDRSPNFYLPKGSSGLNQATWIQIETFFPFEKAALLQKSLQGTISHKLTLDRATILELLDCAINSDDISGEHRDILQEVFNNI